jgi:hypothetical protein
MRALFLLFVLLAACVQVIVAEVTLVGNPQVIYDRSPKLRIKGGGFDAEEHDITIELSAKGAPPLKVDKDFTIDKDEDGEGLILKLLGNRK